MKIRLRARYRSVLWFLFMVVIVITGGIYLTGWRARVADSNLREEILLQTEEIATAINPQLIHQLSFTADDSASPAFQRIRMQMIAYSKLIRQRGIYSMALREGKIVFGPETFSRNDPMSSLPGTVFQQPTPADYAIFRTGRPVVTGPVTDEYGTFISGLSPVIDPYTGKVLMVVGIDIAYSEWRQSLVMIRILPVGATFLTLFLIGLGFFLIYRRSRQTDVPTGQSRYIESYLVAIVGVFLTITISLVSRENERRSQASLFRLQAEPYLEKVRSEFRTIQQNLTLVRDFFFSSHDVERSEFQRFVSPITFNNPGIGFLWAPCVCINSDAGLTDPMQTCIYPVHFIEPSTFQRFRAGFDLQSDPNYRSIMQTSGSLGLVTAGDPEPDLDAGSKKHLILAFDHVSKEQGTYQDSGFVVCMVDVARVVDRIFGRIQDTRLKISLDIVDLVNHDGPKIIASTNPETDHTAALSISPDSYQRFAYSEISPVFAFGRTYAIITYANEDYLRANPLRNWYIVGLSLLLSTLILTILVRFLQNRQVLLSNMVSQKTLELETAKNMAEESDRLKSSLLLNMSHELRTPLNGILGYGEILGEQATDPEEKRMLNNIVLLGQRLLLTFTSMLKLSDLEARKCHPVAESFDPTDIIALETERLRYQADLKQLIIREEIDPGLRMHTDKQMFGDILFFLLDNAIKFTDSGYITISLRRKTDGQKKWIDLSIKDSGIGIKEEHLSIIFEPFRQASEGIGRSHEGNGMGLAICMRYAELLNAEIKAESIYGTGSTFTVRFEDQYAGQDPETIPEQALSVSGTREIKKISGRKPFILIVEDNPANAELAAQYLKHSCVTDTAFSGKAAIAMAWQNDYDLILMDINLGSETDGIQATREIRNIKQYRTVPIIAVTGYSTPSEKKQIMDQGLDDFMSKPYSRDDLMRIIARWIA